MNLAELQRLFVELLAWPTGVRDLARRRPGAAGRLRATFADGVHLSAEACLEIHANAYFQRIHDALAEQFPLLLRLLGPRAFHNLVTDYLWLLPPKTPDLLDLGRRLPPFLAAFRRCRGDPPHLVHFARCEAASLEVLLAPGPAPGPAEAPPTPALDDDPTSLLEARIVLCPPVRIFRSCWSYAAAATALRRGDETIPVEHGAGWDLLYRPHLTVHVRRLDETEGALLHRLLHHPLSFVEFAEAARGAGWPPARLAGALRTFRSIGVLAVHRPGRHLP